jgi:hypothetical protein
MKRIVDSIRRPSTALCLALVGLVTPRPAHADEPGKSGRVVEVRINNPSSDAHPSYHGAITLKLVGSSSLVEYRWGGSSCPGQTLTEAQIDVLVTAFVERSRTKLTPMYTMGEGTGTATRCLVGFTLVAG